MANTNTLAAMRVTVTGNEAGESVSASGGSEARVDCASCSTQAGQLRDEDESPKSRSNSLPQVAQRWRGMRGRMVTGFFGKGKRRGEGNRELKVKC